MKYIVIHQNPYTGEQTAFYTNWFQAENHYTDGMVVIDTLRHLITYDGETWCDIEEDSL